MTRLDMRPTRKELVLQLLREHTGEWVNGPEICSPAVGGSEGLRRIRELREDGFQIAMRRHPDRRRAVRQYQLVRQAQGTVVRIDQEHNVWVQGYYRTKGSEMGNERWEAFNHSYGPWYRMRSEKSGMNGDPSSDGHPVDVLVMPDMDKRRWFWSVKFHAYRPRRPDSRHVPLAETSVHGKEDSLEQAQHMATEAFRRGRPAAISGTSIQKPEE